MSTNEIGKNLGRLEHLPVAIRSRLFGRSGVPNTRQQNLAESVASPLDVPKERATELADGADLILTEPWLFLSTCFGEGGKCPTIRSAIYTRTARDTVQHHGQRELAEGYVANNGWYCLPDRYDDCGYGGANLDRPALQRLLQDIQDGKIDCVVVCDLARLSRSPEDLQEHHGHF